jgi:2-oxoisovalerate dehydrogenase E2 component (dihydrolipoyl transacylase)
MAKQTINVPDVGEGVAEVEIVSWAVGVGDSVTRLSTVAEVMTDTATVEVPAPIDGVVTELGGAVGDVLTVGSPLFVMRAEGEVDDDGETGVAGESGVEAEPVISPPPPAGVTLRPHSTGETPSTESPRPAPASVTSAPATEPPPPPTPPRRRKEGERPLATPAVRARARELGADLRQITGSGPAGRITHDDLERFVQTPPSTTPAAVAGTALSARTPDTSVEEQPVVGLRRRIAERMVASTTTIPHITYVDEVDITALEDLRHQLNRESREQARAHDRPHLTVLPFLVRALTNVIPDFPHLNAHLIEADRGGERKVAKAGTDTLRIVGGVHVGIATQTDNGLIVPVLRHAEAHTVWSAAAAIAELSEATRTGRAKPQDLTGSTISITSLGPLGGIVTTPVINKPEVAIVGVNKIVIRPVWIDGEFVPRKMMNLSSSFDHRVVDGWDAANFVQAVRAQLEQPALLFIDRYEPGAGAAATTPGREDDRG